MFRRTLVATFTATVVEQGTATWAWNGRTMSDRMADGECVSNPKDNLHFDTQYTDHWTQNFVSGSKAGLTEVAYKDNFKVVTSHVAKEQYVLTQCGTSTPTAAEVDAFKPLANYTRKFFIIPLQKLLVLDRTMHGFINVLGLEDRVMGVASSAVAPCLQKAFRTCNQSVDHTNKSEVKAVTASADGFFRRCPDLNATTGLCNELGTNNSIEIDFNNHTDYLQVSEYVLKIMAVFFNKEAEANQLSQARVTNIKKYTALSPKPVVAHISFDNGAASIIIHQVMLEMVTAAGYANVDEVALKAALPALVTITGGSFPTLTLSVANYQNTAALSEAFFTALSNVSAFIDWTSDGGDPTAYDINSFYAKFGLNAANQSLVAGKKILRRDSTMNSDKYLEWDESVLARPDKVAEGLRYSISGDASLRQHYFRNIAAGETPRVLTEASCSKPMPGCGASNKPQAIKHTMVTPTTSTTTVIGASRPAQASGANAVSCFTVLLLSAVALLRA